MKTSLLRNMTALLLALVAVLCLQPSPAAQTPAPQAAKWERYAFPGDEFSVELPGMPFVFHTRRQITLTESETTRVFGHYADGIVYRIEAYDKPRREETPELLAARSSGADTVTKGVTVGGFVGKEYRSPRGAGRVFRTKKRVYLLSAFGREQSNPSVERFLDSLTLSDRPRGREIAEAAAPAPLGVGPPPVASGPGRGGNTQTDKDQPPPRPQSVPDDDPTRVFLNKEVTQKAVIVYKGDPGFTEEARRNNVSGVVRLRAILRATGRVTDIAVIKTLPDGLTERAVYAARHILFFPARKDGRDVSQYVTLEYNFNIY